MAGLVALAGLAVGVLLGALGGLTPSATPAGASGSPPAANTRWADLYPEAGLVSLPFVLVTPKRDYMYSSGLGAPDNIPMRTFTVMGHFSRTYNPLPTLPPWVLSGTATWSPDVRQVGRRRYVMWFSAVARKLPAGDTQTPPPRCLGWAVATNPYGPFVSHADRPAICQWDQFGDIDPRTYVQDGQEYLLWKSDDNAGMTPPGHTYKPTKLWSQRLASDGTTLDGSPVKLLQNTQPWEGAVVEAPDMVRSGGRDYLFFSSTSSFALTQDAGIGVAECAGPSGPCQDTNAGPWLGSSVAGEGPNEESLMEQHGQVWLLFSAHASYYPTAVPELAVAKVDFDGGQPYLAALGGEKPHV